MAHAQSTSEVEKGPSTRQPSLLRRSCNPAIRRAPKAPSRTRRRLELEIVTGMAGFQKQTAMGFPSEDELHMNASLQNRLQLSAQAKNCFQCAATISTRFVDPERQHKLRQKGHRIDDLRSRSQCWPHANPEIHRGSVQAQLPPRSKTRGKTAPSI